MRDTVRIEITQAFVDIDPEAMEAAAGDPVQAAINELGFSGLDVVEAEVYDYLELEIDSEGDVVSLDAHPELTDEDTV